MLSFFKRRKPSEQHDVLLTKAVIRILEQRSDSNFHLDDLKIDSAGKVVVIIRADQGPSREEVTALEHKIQVTLKGESDVKDVAVIVTSEKPASPTSPQMKTSAPHASMKPARHIIAVASGKGGVGKSTVAVNIAVALSRLGQKVGILDADIYGPSLPRLLARQTEKAVQGEDGRLLPVICYGLKAMSMGFMVDESAPMIWRGPMVQSALLQMIRDVDWGDLDILVIDLPPGTGDIHLTLAQRVPLSGGVVVSTPQDISLIDARKGLEMFRKVAVPILGIVENMSYFCCPNCGHTEHIFGHGGARLEAEKLGVPFLGEIPLHTKIRELSDAGTPPTFIDPDGEQAKAFQNIAAQVLETVEIAQRPPPKIVMME